MEHNIWLDGIMGVVVGDALGMPVQFMRREELAERPVESMEGYGSYDMPAGTWSDDSSMALATMASILDKGNIDLKDIMMKFVDWLQNGEYTPFGEAFDEGNTCVDAIENFIRDEDTVTCGITGEYANGNGSLMRILPVTLYCYERQKKVCTLEDEAIEMIHRVAGLYYGYAGIPKERLAEIQRREWIEEMCQQMKEKN